MKTYFRKIKQVVENVIGTATVVSPELIINKLWSPDTDTVDTVMKVPSKNFYDYLGHYICPDEALKDGDENRGLGLGPYNNDLGKALDKLTFSSPAPIALNTGGDNNETVNQYFTQIGSTDRWEVNTRSDSLVPNLRNNDAIGIGDYTLRLPQVGEYNWKGTWGDTENGFETSVIVKINVNMKTGNVPGGFDGKLNPTGANYTIWIGDAGDIKQNSSYRTQQNTKLFYNQHFSTGFVYVGNDSTHSKAYIVTINRKPFESKLIINAVSEARGGEYIFLGIRRSPFQWNIGILGATINLGAILNALFNPIIDIINDVFKIIMGNNKAYESTVTADAEIISSNIASLDKTELEKHPAIKYFGQIDYHSYMFTQFYYPYFDQNPLYPYTDKFNYKKPYLENKVVESRFRNNLTSSDSYLSKKYLYYVPSLFCLLFETKIGVFYEQLAKQLKNDSGTGNEINLNIKLTDHKTTIDPKIYKEKQEKHLYNIMYPTNETVWNSYLENTGWTDECRVDNVSFLQNFIAGADVPGNIISGSNIQPYDSVFSDYSFLPQTSISAINDVIGDFVTIDSILKTDVGYDLNTWTALCDPNNGQFKTLTTGQPKNLAYKIIQFIIWYLEPNGIAEQTRLSVSSLLEFEKYLDQEIEDLNNEEDSTPDIYHIVGTDLYERECK